MAPLVQIVIKVAALSFVFGQLARISLHQFSFPVIDLIIISLAILTFLSSFKTINFRHPWWKFIIYSWLVLVINLITLHSFGLIPILYLIRLTSLLVIVIVAPKLSRQTANLLDLCLISLVIFGIIQYFLWPNLTFLSANNWDPHLNRLVASFFDPTFTAIIYLFFIIKSAIYPQKLSIALPTIALSYLAMSLTYSRSTFLSLVIASLFIAIKKTNMLIFVGVATIVALTLLVLPKKEGEGNRLERTSTITAKIENYQQGLKLLARSPVFGIGYNTIGYHRSQIENNSHAKWGFDGSLLTITITGGIIGLFLFLLGLVYEFKQNNLLSQAILISLLTHSFFANSLLFPWMLLYFGLTKYRN